jgi:hypothetical protein
MKNNLTYEQLQAMIDEAIADAIDEEEALMGIYGCMDEKLEVPFPAKVIGEDVIITSFYQGEDRIEAEVTKGNKKYTVDLKDVEYDPEKVKGYEWIEAYRFWKGD